MSDDDQTSNVQSDSERALVIASLICFAVLMCCYWIGKPLLELIEDGWVKLISYGTIPVVVTFTVLYRGRWHQEITDLSRTIILLLLSSAILVGVLLAVAVMVCIVWFCEVAVFSGFNP